MKSPREDINKSYYENTRSRTQWKDEPPDEDFFEMLVHQSVESRERDGLGVLGQQRNVRVVHPDLLQPFLGACVRPSSEEILCPVAGENIQCQHRSILSSSGIRNFVRAWEPNKYYSRQVNCRIFSKTYTTRFQARTRISEYFLGSEYFCARRKCFRRKHSSNRLNIQKFRRNSKKRIYIFQRISIRLEPETTKAYVY